MDRLTEEPLRGLIDHQIRVAKSRWERLPQINSHIDDWDTEEAEDVILDYDIEEERFERLKKSFLQGLMTQKQAIRFEELAEIITRNKPILERLRQAP